MYVHEEMPPDMFMNFRENAFLEFNFFEVEN